MCNVLASDLFRNLGTSKGKLFMIMICENIYLQQQ